MDRRQLHDAQRPVIVDHVVRAGHHVEPAPVPARFDFVVDGRLRVALRVAQPSTARRRVQLHGRVYHYTYRGWIFNFHHRGRLAERYCDVLICLPVMPEVPADPAAAFVLPWTAITGKTFALSDSRRPYAGRYAPYRNAWDLLRSPDPSSPAAA